MQRYILDYCSSKEGSISFRTVKKKIEVDSEIFPDVSQLWKGIGMKQ